MFCQKCGSELTDEVTICPNCSSSVDASNDSEERYNNMNTTEKESTVNENVESETNLVPVDVNPNGGTIALVCFIATILVNFISFYLISLGPTSTILTVSLAIIGIKNFSTRKTKAYIVKCPFCGQEFQFPVNNLNTKCPKCNKLVILKDNKFEIVDSDN